MRRAAPTSLALKSLEDFYLPHKTSSATHQKDRRTEHKEQTNYIKLSNKMMVCLLAWQTGIQAMRFISAQLMPITDRWLAHCNGHRIVSNSCKPHRDVDEFAGWIADELALEDASSS